MESIKNFINTNTMYIIASIITAVVGFGMYVDYTAVQLAPQENNINVPHSENNNGQQELIILENAVAICESHGMLHSMAYWGGYTNNENFGSSEDFTTLRLKLLNTKWVDSKGLPIGISGTYQLGINHQTKYAATEDAMKTNKFIFLSFFGICYSHGE